MSGQHSRSTRFQNHVHLRSSAGGMLMADEGRGFQAVPGNGCGSTEEDTGLSLIDARIIAEVLHENIRLRRELRRLGADLPEAGGIAAGPAQAASLAHEIKQPIAAAVLSAQACLKWLQCDPPHLARARQSVARMISDTMRAAGIVDGVRSLYVRGALKREPVDLNQIIRSIAALLRDLAIRSSISIHAQLDKNLPRIRADFVQLQQVLTNLMINGIEAMEQTGGELTLISRRTEDDEIIVAVSDLGIGLPAGGSDPLFREFFTTKPEGTGLGLSISRTIIESHGGRLWAEANTGRGATFQFTLPVR